MLLNETRSDVNRLNDQVRVMTLTQRNIRKNHAKVQDDIKTALKALKGIKQEVAVEEVRMVVNKENSNMGHQHLHQVPAGDDNTEHTDEWLSQKNFNRSKFRQNHSGEHFPTANSAFEGGLGQNHSTPAGGVVGGIRYDSSLSQFLDESMMSQNNNPFATNNVFDLPHDLNKYVGRTPSDLGGGDMRSTEKSNLLYSSKVSVPYPFKGGPVLIQGKSVPTGASRV